MAFWSQIAVGTTRRRVRIRDKDGRPDSTVSSLTENAELCVLFFPGYGFLPDKLFKGKISTEIQRYYEKDHGQIHDHIFSKSSATSVQEIVSHWKEREREKGQSAPAERSTSNLEGDYTEPDFSSPWRTCAQP